MKFSDVYKSDMNNIQVSEISVAKIITYSKETINKKSNFNMNKFIKIAVATVCIYVLLTTVYLNRNMVQAYAESIFGNFTVNFGDKKVEIGEIQPIQVKFDEFVACEGVNVIEEDDNKNSYWKLYDVVDELEKETGIVMVISPLLKVSDRTKISVTLMPYGYGHINASYTYGEYYINIDGMFTYNDYKRDMHGYGYGISGDDKYDFTYKSPNGMKVYFVNHSKGRMLYFQAGNILHKLNSDASLEDLKKLIDSFEIK